MKGEGVMIVSPSEFSFELTNDKNSKEIIEKCFIYRHCML